MNNTVKFSENSSLLADKSKTARALVNSIFDELSVVELDTFMSGKDFVSGELALGEGVITGYATFGGTPVYFFAHNPEVLGGSISVAQAQKILKVMDKAIASDTPFVSIINSKGARVGEGIAVMEGYTSLIAGAFHLQAAVPHICIVDGTAVGMMSAFIGTADFVIARDSASVSFNPPMVVAAKAGQTKAKQFAPSSLRSSLVSWTYTDIAQVKGYIQYVFDLLEGISDCEGADDPNRTSDFGDEVTVSASLSAVLDEGKFLELYSSFAPDTMTGFGKINDISVAIIASNPTAGEFFTAQSLQKITRFANLVTKLDLPLVTFVDSKGIDSDLAAEESGICLAATEVLGAIGDISHKLCVITGNAIGFAYSALCSKAVGFDYTLALADSVLSPVLPSVAVNLYTDDINAAKDPIAARADIEKRYIEDTANPFVSAKDGYVDNIIEAADMRPYIASALLMTLGL